MAEAKKKNSTDLIVDEMLYPDPLNTYILNAIYEHATDIHLNVADEGMVILFRVDGFVHEKQRLSRAEGRKLLNQIKADVMAKPVVVTSYPDASTIGAALIAAVGASAFAFADGLQWRKRNRRRVFEPGEKNTVLYREASSRYVQLDEYIRATLQRQR